MPNTSLYHLRAASRSRTRKAMWRTPQIGMVGLVVSVVIEHLRLGANEGAPWLRFGLPMRAMAGQPGIQHVLLDWGNRARDEELDLLVNRANLSPRRPHTLLAELGAHLFAVGPVLVGE